MKRKKITNQKLRATKTSVRAQIQYLDGLTDYSILKQVLIDFTHEANVMNITQQEPPNSQGFWVGAN